MGHQWHVAVVLLVGSFSRIVTFLWVAFCARHMKLWWAHLPTCASACVQRSIEQCVFRDYEGSVLNSSSGLFCFCFCFCFLAQFKKTHLFTVIY